MADQTDSLLLEGIPSYRPKDKILEISPGNWVSLVDEKTGNLRSDYKHLWKTRNVLEIRKYLGVGKQLMVDSPVVDNATNIVMKAMHQKMRESLSEIPGFKGPEKPKS